MPVEADSVVRYEAEPNLQAPICEAIDSSIPASYELEGTSPYSPITRKPVPPSHLDSSSSTNPLRAAVQPSPLPPTTENEEGEGEEAQLHQELERVKAKKLRLQKLQELEDEEEKLQRRLALMEESKRLPRA